MDGTKDHQVKQNNSGHWRKIYGNVVLIKKKYLKVEGVLFWKRKETREKEGRWEKVKGVSTINNYMIIHTEEFNNETHHFA